MISLIDLLQIFHTTDIETKTHANIKNSLQLHTSKNQYHDIQKVKECGVITACMGSKHLLSVGVLW